MKERNHALDIYRLICVFLITTIHAIEYGDLLANVNQPSLNFILINLLKSLQLFSISGFMMISAYFLIENGFSIKKIVVFELQLIFYSLVILLFSSIFFSSFSLKGALKSLFPVATNHYWYALSYMIILVASSFLNKIVKLFSKAELKALIISLSVVVCLIFHLLPTYDPATYVGHPTHGLLWFILVYFIAAYIKLYPVKNVKKYGVLTFIITLFFTTILYLVKSGLFGIIHEYPLVKLFFKKINLISYNSVLALLLTVSSFVIFCNLKLKFDRYFTRVLSFCVPSFFVIYLIQEHVAVRVPLWQFVKTSRFSDSIWLIPYIVAVFFALFLVAIALYMLYLVARRIFIARLEKVLVGLLENGTNKLSKKSSNIDCSR